MGEFWTNDTSSIRISTGNNDRSKSVSQLAIVFLHNCDSFLYVLDRKYTDRLNYGCLENYVSLNYPLIFVRWLWFVSLSNIILKVIEDPGDLPTCAIVDSARIEKDRRKKA